MVHNTELLAALQLPTECTDNEISLTLIALLTAAVHETLPSKSLLDLCRIISIQGGSQYLDPLNMLPILLPYKDPGAVELVSMIGEFGLPKEVVMAVQETAERLKQSFETDLDEPDTEESENASGSTRIEQVKTLLDLFALAIPRLNLRRKSCPETIQSLFEEIKDLLKISGTRMGRDEARSMLSSTSQLAERILHWVNSVTENLPEDRKIAKVMIKELLDCVTRSCVPNLHTSIAQRTFEECLPRFVVKSSLGDDWKVAETSISQLLDSYKSIDIDLHACTEPISVAHLVASAYRYSCSPKADKRLAFLLPVLLSCLQTNTFLDESLAVLIRCLHNWTTSPDSFHQHLSPDITVPLSDTLPTVASIHSDPLVRHQAYRALSLLLSASESRLRFQTLAELTGRCQFPQMRVAAVGLVKERFLNAFDAPDSTISKNDPLLSNMFLRTFGPILFRPDPPDLLGESLDLQSFQECSEHARLAECLSLYFIILRKDEKNITGIRDKDMLKTIENNLLAPMRKTLGRWMKDPSISQMHPLSITPLALLLPGLERVDSAIKELKS